MVHSYAGTLALYITEDWKLIQRMIDFKALGEDEHKGVFAAIQFVRSAGGRGGLNKIRSISNRALIN